MVVKPAPKLLAEELIIEMGFEHFQYETTSSLDTVLRPDDERISLGYYRDCLFVCLPFELTDEFFHAEEYPFEASIISLFPDAEIFVSSLESAINHWAYCFIEKGKKIRFRIGDSERDAIAFGEPLSEEKELLAQSSINAEGKRIYRLDDFPDEDFFEDQVGENFVFQLFSRYIGEQLDAAEEDFFEMEMKVFKEGKGISSVVGTNKSWWRFW